jgi:hypothetical protein
MIARKAVAGAVVAASLFVAPTASATPRWVDRLLTLPGPVAGTINLDGAFAHADEPCGPNICGYNGLGSSIEGVLGLASRVDIGLHVGLRGFVDGSRVNEGVIANADAYARMFDQLAFYGGVAGPNSAQQLIWGNDVITNPDLKVRVRILHLKHLFELGVEVRHNLPVLTGTVFNVVAGVPMALHFGHHVRFDFGGYTGFTFYGNAGPFPYGTSFSFYAPAALWFQIDRVYLGPLFGFRWYDHDVYPGANPNNQNWDFMLGFGLGVSLGHYVDFQLQSYFPRLNAWEEKQFGVGAGVQFYFGRRERERFNY